MLFLRSTALSMDELLRPPTKTDNTILVERLAKCLLSVAICLPNSLDSKIQTVMSTPPPQTEEPESKLRYTITGFVCLAPLQLGMERHRSSSLAICIANAYQTRGYGGEAVNWALDWGFRHANLHRMALAPHLRSESGLAPGIQLTYASSQSQDSSQP